MPQSLLMEIKGLYSFPNDSSAVPAGALAVADDIVINRDSVAEPRRGLDVLDTGFSDISHRANKLFFYQNKLLAHHSTNKLSYYNAGVWTEYPTAILAPSNPDTESSFPYLKIRAAAMNQNLYFTTSTGVQKLDSYSGTPTPAGAYKALDVDAEIPGTPTAAWLVQDYAVAYRVIWGYRDANNNLIRSTPSQRAVIKNTGSTADVRLSITVPDGVTTAWFYQVYRSASVDNSTADVEPNDELGLVYEANPSSTAFSGYTKTFAPGGVDTATETITITSHGFSDGDAVVFSSSGTLPTGLTAGTIYYVISSAANTFKVSATYGGSATNLTATGSGTHTVAGANVVTVTDITPDELRGATIYTAGTQEGLANQNEPPPYALDIAVYKNRLFFANVKSKYRYFLTLLSADAPSGVQAGDTLRIQTLDSGGAVTGYVEYTAAASEDIAAKQFKVYTAGSVSQNIRDTALSLARVINRNALSTVNAFYLSGPDDLPGKLLLEEESIGGYGFAVISSRDTCWSPTLPSTGTDERATNDAAKNGICYSKDGIPDAVPLVNKLYAGSADKETLRIVALTDALFIFREDGVYKLSGDNESNFRIDFTDTMRLIAPESVAVLNNQIFALSDQGVVAISSVVPQVKSRPIEDRLLSLQGADLDALRNASFAIAYETERKYILFVPSAVGDTVPQQAYVYTTFTNTWVRWVLAKTCGLVNPSEDKLYLGDAITNYINMERKTYSYRDYADFRDFVTVSGISGTTLTVTGTDNMNEGDVIEKDGDYVVIESVDTVAGTVTTTYEPAFATGTAELLYPINSKIKWVPFTLSNPGIVKQFREVTLLFKADFAGAAELVFSSDVSAAPEIEDIEGAGVGSWGLFPWGEALWGGAAAQRPIRTLVPRNKQRCSQLSVEFRHGRGYTSYQLAGISIIANPIGERVRK